MCVCVFFIKVDILKFSHSIKKIILELFSWRTDSTAANAPLNFASLHLDNSTLEYDYIHQPDYLLRFSILLSWLVGLSVVLMEFDYNASSESFFWVPYEMMFVLTVLLFITWYKNFCYWRYSLDNVWYSPTSCWIFKISETMQKNLTIRVAIYMYILVSYIVLVSIVLVSRKYGRCLSENTKDVSHRVTVI